MDKTNAMRMLERAKIAYDTVEYECGDEDGIIGLNAAAQTKEILAGQCFKTLVARGERRGILVFCVPVTGELNLKAAAVAARDKRVELTHVKELFDLTGYIRGGCSPIGMKKKYPTFIDASAQKYDKIGISGGKRGLQLILNPLELAKFLNAQFYPIIKGYDVR
jgi:Cys-tRNA(Pro)/Cys-tRNA(Cys) deacylase